MRLFKSQDGAAAVEMALLLPVLVVLAFGIVEFSTALNRSQGMQAAVREGGRFAALGEDLDDDDANLDEIRDRVHGALQSNAAGAGFPAPGRSLSDVVVEATDDSSTSSDFLCDPDGDATEVTVTAYVGSGAVEYYTMQLLVVTGPGFDYRAEARFPCVHPSFSVTP